MQHQDSHLSDEHLLLELEGELSTNASKQVRAHLEACWQCRSRRLDLENTIADFIRFHRREFDAQLPPADGPRALLKARLAQFSANEVNRPMRWFGLFHRHALPLLATGFGMMALGLLLVGALLHRAANASAIVFTPDSKLTPGATVLADRKAICSLQNVKNKAVSVALQKKVFEEYGIRNAEPRAYEVDYLVTPALGGADDIRNLWPHSYSAAWNAKVKDELEDRLREMVCDGRLDLAQAQQEIAANWIAAYKKYFHTDKPLSTQ
jgi:hypothetical protein